MASIDIWLTLWGLAIFSAAGVFGVLRPSWSGWRWVDVVYYPLSAVAVALILYSSGDINRDLERALEAKRHQESEWRRRPNVPPGVPIVAMSREALLDHYQWLDLETRLGEACRYSSSEDCLAATGHADEIKRAYRNWSYPKPNPTPTEMAIAEDDFCDRGERLISALEDGVNFGAYSELKVALREYAANRNERQSLVSMRRRVEYWQARFLPLIDPEDRPFAARLGAAEV